MESYPTINEGGLYHKETLSYDDTFLIEPTALVSPVIMSTLTTLKVTFDLT